MKLEIESTVFGSMTIGEIIYDHDVIIDLEGQIKKRKKKLSKAIYGTSHIISGDEAEYVFEEGASIIIIGAGQYSRVSLSDQADIFFKQNNCKVILQSTAKAIKTWNDKKEQKTIGLFHVTC